MGDNHRDEVIKEAVFQIYQDGLYTLSHAGANFLVAGPRYAGMTAWGIEAEWHALRTSPTLIDKFLKIKKMDRNTANEIICDEYVMPTKIGDDRAIFCSEGKNTPKARDFTLKGGMGLNSEDYFYNSWAGTKFTGVYSTASMPKYSPRQSKDWADTDIPMMRIAEAYLIRAEAKARKSGNWNDALADVNIIRDRANATPLAKMEEEDMLDEWSREFWFEGRRRMDLVRFGRYFGPEADQYRYQWEARMGKDDGVQFFVSGTPEYMNWFPVPSEDKRSNPNFKTDVEEAAGNKFAAQGGDGYAY